MGSESTKGSQLNLRWDLDVSLVHHLCLQGEIEDSAAKVEHLWVLCKRVPNGASRFRTHERSRAEMDRARSSVTDTWTDTTQLHIRP